MKRQKSTFEYQRNKKKKTRFTYPAAGFDFYFNFFYGLYSCIFMKSGVFVGAHL